MEVGGVKMLEFAPLTPTYAGVAFPALNKYGIGSTCRPTCPCMKLIIDGLAGIDEININGGNDEARIRRRGIARMAARIDG
jgi:hypothetical protein